ncbi:submandibular glandular kallikrein-9-like [Cimex lectularius]|uniref:Peptidase S1 domain-containing protein n=1 Tax=Cimex lectularius TaxID=79782 RepID=A0A8I6TFJ8_CIMLE|nr:submandibular glandular kallikrein-9-like [Cimex lectularius]
MVRHIRSALYFIWIFLTFKILKADEGKIVGGRVAQPGEFPFQLCMWGEQRCGGALVTMRQFMTAAHCFVKKSSKNDITKHFMIAGVVDCTKKDDPFYQKRGIKDYKMHPDFAYKKDMTAYHDFAIGIVDKPFDQSERVKVGAFPNTDPAKFRQYWEDISKNGKKCLAMGFGAMTDINAKDFSNDLKIAEMNPKDPAFCKTTHMYDSDKLMDGEVCCIPENVKTESQGKGDAGTALVCEGFMFGVGTAGYFQPDYNVQYFTLAYPYLNLIEKESGYICRSSHMAVIFGFFTVVVVNGLQF